MTDGFDDTSDSLGGEMLDSLFEDFVEEDTTTYETDTALDEQLLVPPPTTGDTDEYSEFEQPEEKPEEAVEPVPEETELEVPPAEPEPPIEEPAPAPETEAEGVYGSSHEWTADWFFQEGDGYCGPTSAAIIINEYFEAGITDPEYMVNQAYELGLTEDISQGMYMSDVQTLLSANGVPCENVTSSMDDLATRLEDGYGIIAFVDSGELWDDAGDAVSEDSRPDHFLVVTEVDTNTGTVTLEDPGDPNGNSREVPISEFEDAWADSNYEMISTTSSDPDLGGSVNDPKLAIANVTGSVVIH